MTDGSVHHRLPFAPSAATGPPAGTGAERPLGGDPDEAPPPPAPPFPDAELPAAIDAAGRLWEVLAARAWRSFERRGRGVLLIEHDALLTTAAAVEAAAAEAAAAADADGPADPARMRALTEDLVTTWIPATIVSRGDDFRGLLQRSEPRRQVMVLVRHRSGAEALFALESNGTTRPDPPTCAAAD